MKKNIITIGKYLKWAFCLVFITLFNQPGFANPGETIFKNQCAVCHRIGKGKLVGPDLAGVTEKRSMDWLIKFTRGSQAFIKSGDPDANAIYQEYNQIAMPDFNLTDEEIRSIFQYVELKSPAKTETTAQAEEEVDDEPAGRSIADATQADIETGRLLFSGALSFQNGAASCLSCHHVVDDLLIGGGFLAKDLTQVYGRMGEAGLMALLKSPPFPAMVQSYKNRPLTEDEIFQLTAYLQYADKNVLYQTQDTSQYMLLWGGGGILLLLLSMIGVLWFNRGIPNGKDKIFNRQLKSK